MEHGEKTKEDGDEMTEGDGVRYNNNHNDHDDDDEEKGENEETRKKDVGVADAATPTAVPAPAPAAASKLTSLLNSGLAVSVRLARLSPVTLLLLRLDDMAAAQRDDERTGRETDGEGDCGVAGEVEREQGGVDANADVDVEEQKGVENEVGEDG